jgi:putative membrane protein
MNSYILFRYLHLVSIFLLVGSVFAQQFLVKRKLPKKALKAVLITDSIYGIASILTVAFGMVLWFGVGKPATFYSDNTTFWVKMCLFIVVGLLSVYPTVFYLKNRKNQNEVIIIPARLIYILRMEAILLFVIPFFAELMAFGVIIF